MIKLILVMIVSGNLYTQEEWFSDIESCEYAGNKIWWTAKVADVEASGSFVCVEARRWK